MSAPEPSAWGDRAVMDPCAGPGPSRALDTDEGAFLPTNSHLLHPPQSDLARRFSTPILPYGPHERPDIDFFVAANNFFPATDSQARYNISYAFDANVAAGVAASGSSTWDPAAAASAFDWSASPRLRNAGSEAGPSRVMSPSKQRRQQKKPNRSRASCDGCRRRRTRCDRILPCSECTKRKLPCQYNEATQVPLLALNREANEAQDREEYIARLEERIRQLERAAALPSASLMTDDSPKSPSSVGSLAPTSNLGAAPPPAPPDTTSAEPSPEIDSGAADSRSQALRPPPAAGSSARSLLSSPYSDALVDLNANELAADLCSLSLGPSFRAERTRARGPFAADLHRLASAANSHPPVEVALTSNVATLTSPSLDSSVRLDFVARDGPQTVEDVLAILPTADQVQTLIKTGLYAVVNMGSVDAEGFPRMVQDFYTSGSHLCLPPERAEHDEPNQSDRNARLHQISCILAFCAAALHQDAPSKPFLPGLGTIAPDEAIMLAQEWTRASLRALVIGAIFDRPTLHGVRALVLLGYLPLHLSALRTSMFAWSTATFLAGELGLHNEPPVRADEEGKLSRKELESRRTLMHSLLGLEWGAAGCFHKTWQLSDPDALSCNPPGMDPTVCELDEDGWPLDVSICCMRASAGFFRLNHHITTAIARGSLKYSELLALEQRIEAFDGSMPYKLHWRIEGTKLVYNTLDFVERLAVAQMQLGRLPVLVRTHRLIVLGSLALSPADAERHMEKLLTTLKTSLLMFIEMPPVMFSHPLTVLLCLDFTCTFCAVLLKSHPHEPLLEPEFSLLVLRRIVDLLAQLPGTPFRAGSASISALVAKCEARFRSLPPEGKRRRASTTEDVSDCFPHHSSAESSHDGEAGPPHKATKTESPIVPAALPPPPATDAKASRPTRPLPARSDRPRSESRAVPGWHFTAMFTFKAPLAEDPSL